MLALLVATAALRLPTATAIRHPAVRLSGAPATTAETKAALVKLLPRSRLLSDEARALIQVLLDSKPDEPDDQGLAALLSDGGSWLISCDAFDALLYEERRTKRLSKQLEGRIGPMIRQWNLAHCCSAFGAFKVEV